jgi:hypothetical protein
LSELGDAGHTAALVLLVIGGLANFLWLVIRPPLTAADTWWRVAVGMTTAILLMPASRYGYFVYVVVFAGFMLFFREACRDQHSLGRPVRVLADAGTKVEHDDDPTSPGHFLAR